MALMNWQSHLAVKYKLADGQEELITPIDSFQPSFNLSAEALHSIERTHIGVGYSPKAITFSMSVKAIGTAAAQLMKLAFEGTPFDIVLVEAEDSNGPQWSFKEVMLQQCIITNATPTAAATSGVPTATFSGFSLAGSINVANTKTSIPSR